MDETKTNNLHGDIWTVEDDLLLAETVLRYVREGKSLVSAFEDFEEVTKGRRTKAAAKFRWNTKLRDHYAAAYELAKEEGRKIRNYKKRKVNQGERYKDIVENILDKDEKRDITPDDLLVLVREYKKQEEEKREKNNNKDNLVKKLKQENERLKKELEATNKEKTDIAEAFKFKDKQYKELLNALTVLKNAGISINIPEQEDFKYAINKDGTIEKI